MMEGVNAMRKKAKKKNHKKRLGALVLNLTPPLGIRSTLITPSPTQ